MHPSYMHPVTSGSEFHCTRLFTRRKRLQPRENPRNWGMHVDSVNLQAFKGRGSGQGGGGQNAHSHIFHSSRTRNFLPGHAQNSPKLPPHVGVKCGLSQSTVAGFKLAKHLVLIKFSSLSAPTKIEELTALCRS